MGGKDAATMDLRTCGPADLRTCGPADLRTCGPADLRVRVGSPPANMKRERGVPWVRRVRA